MDWSIVVPGKRSILSIGDVEDEDEEEYEAFEDSPPFINLESADKDDVDDVVVGYMRVDHMEGINLN